MKCLNMRNEFGSLIACQKRAIFDYLLGALRGPGDRPSNQSHTRLCIQHSKCVYGPRRRSEFFNGLRINSLRSALDRFSFFFISFSFHYTNGIYTASKQKTYMNNRAQDYGLDTKRFLFTFECCFRCCRSVWLRCLGMHRSIAGA